MAKKVARGLYKNHGIGGLPDDAVISDDTITMHIVEDQYRARGYLPPFEMLLWKEEYDLKKSK